MPPAEVGGRCLQGAKRGPDRLHRGTRPFPAKGHTGPFEKKDNHDEKPRGDGGIDQKGRGGRSKAMTAMNYRRKSRFQSGIEIDLESNVRTILAQINRQRTPRVPITTSRFSLFSFLTASSCIAI
jgi:hypothetical protein